MLTSGVEAPTIPACCMLMMLHCSQHQHRDFSSSWTPCSHLVLRMTSPSASAKQRLWPLVEVTIIAPEKGDGEHLKRSQPFIYLGMLYEDRKIKHAIQARFSRACASVGSILSPDLQCANLVQLLVRLQQAILQLVPRMTGAQAPADAAGPGLGAPVPVALSPSACLLCQELCPH